MRIDFLDKGSVDFHTPSGLRAARKGQPESTSSTEYYLKLLDILSVYGPKTFNAAIDICDAIFLSLRLHYNFQDGYEATVDFPAKIPNKAMVYRCCIDIFTLFGWSVTSSEAYRLFFQPQAISTPAEVDLIVSAQVNGFASRAIEAIQKAICLNRFHFTAYELGFHYVPPTMYQQTLNKIRDMLHPEWRLEVDSSCKYILHRTASS